MTRTKGTFLAFLALLLSPMAANAAFITIDDSDVDTITITAGDFERCFSVNGVELTCGLGDSGSITLDDGLVHNYEGSWIDLGGSDSGFDAHYFGLLDIVYSGIEWQATSDGFYGTISGAFVGFDPLVSFGSALGVIPQDGSARDFSQPFSRNTYTSEAASVPEPGTLALLGIGLAAIGMTRRRKAA